MEQLNKILDDFIKGTKEFKGANGGDPMAPLWFCGLENGSGKYMDFQREHNEKILNDDTYVRMPWEDQNFRGFNGKLRRLLRKHLNRLTDYPTTVAAMYSAKTFYCTNLYPLAFKNEWDGDAEIQRLTGLPTKAAYKEHCIARRLGNPKWAEHIAAARVIVGMHQPSANDFIRLFMMNGGTPEVRKIQLRNSDSTSDSTVEIIRKPGRTLILCPHPTSWNWNTSMDAMTQIIRDELARQTKK